MMSSVTLKFCGNDTTGGGSSSCCDAAADAALQAQFDAMDVKPADGECARLVKSMLCSVSMIPIESTVLSAIFSVSPVEHRGQGGPLTRAAVLIVEGHLADATCRQFPASVLPCLPSILPPPAFRFVSSPATLLPQPRCRRSATARVSCGVACVPIAFDDLLYAERSGAGLDLASAAVVGANWVDVLGRQELVGAQHGQAPFRGLLSSQERCRNHHQNQPTDLGFNKGTSLP